MAFPEQNPRPFTKVGVETISPGQIGCYGIFKQGTWIYVGRGDIRERLLSHVNGENPCIARNQPTSFVAEVTAYPERREKELILELTPVCNQKVG